MNFDFDAWWKEMKPAECDELKPYFEESWQLGFKDGYEKGVAAFHEAVKIEREKCAMVAAEAASAEFNAEIARLTDALRMAADEPNIDKARKIADAALTPNKGVR